MTPISTSFNKRIINKKIASIILFIVFCNIGRGQDVSNFIKFNQSFSGSSIVQEDYLGFIWVSNNQGIYKFDGYDFAYHPYSDIFGNGFIEDKEFVVEKDSKNNFWISSFKGELTKIEKEGNRTSFKDTLTLNGAPTRISAIGSLNNLVVFGSENGRLYFYDYGTLKIDSLSILPKLNSVEQLINTIVFTDEETLWVSSKNGAIYKYSMISKKLEILKGPIQYGGQNITLESGTNGDLWIGTEFQGLFRYNENNEIKFKQYDSYKYTNNESKALFLSLKCDKSGIIWAGTDGDGVYKINPYKDKVTIYRHEEINNSSLSNNTIVYIQEDSHGNMWIVDKKGVINILQKSNDNINYFNGLESNKPTAILSVLEARDGSIWMGTDGSGINRVFPDNKKIQYCNLKKDSSYFQGKFIQNLYEDSNGNIWIATYQNGLWFYNSKENIFSKIIFGDIEDLHSEDTRFIFEDSKHRIWVTSGAGVSVFSLNRTHIATFDYNSNGLFGKHSFALCEDENNTIWLAVNSGGLFKLNEDLKDLKDSYFTRFNYYLKSRNEFVNYNIQSLAPDYKGSLWILCTSGKLIKYDLKTDHFESFENFEAIKDINISSILLQDSKNLWLSSSEGVHHFQTEPNVTTSYYQIDGLQSNSFIKRSAFKSETGTLYFGGANGLNSFSPKDIKKKEIKPKLYINDVEVLNKPALSLLSKQIKGRIENVDKLKLLSNQSSFSFQFSAIGNLLNSNYHYAYRLVGFDKDWIVSKNNRVASYTNIPFGNYTFEVKAGSKRSEWDIASKRIAIKIKAPWWYSIWAFISYSIILLLLSYGIVVWLRLKRKLVKEEWQHKQEKEMYALKMNFFAKMSHEIQSPLTLILGPIEDMLERAGSKGNELLRQRLTIIKNNASRLSRIATELMTVRNKELGKLRIFASKNNLTSHLKNITLSFTEQARFKNIDFIQEYEQEDFIIWYDRDKIEHIIYNLLSNAFKFTPKEGSVSLKVAKSLDDDFVKISILDSGPGIPKEELEDIFKLFYQSDLGKHEKGFGIGLALTKELIMLHKGSINVVSSPNNGTEFSVKLLTSDTVFSENEKIHVESTKQIKESLDKNIDGLGRNFKIESNIISNKNFKILLVEDNIEMQIFLQDIFVKNYTVLIAENGKEGIELAEKNMPDLILSDIMMPVMNGIEMCNYLKNNNKTSHIPIILLTAKNTTNAKISGLKSGAIEYIQKPFNIYELLLKVNNIIGAKEKVLSKYKAEIASSPKESSGKSKDDIFMENLVNVLNDNLDNSDFKLEEISGAINMSYSVIYRKCQEITGLTLIEFVRSIRLKKAAFLIVKQGYNISEAAFMVGYKDSKYFSKCFKEEFGVTPNYLKKEVKKVDLEILLEKYKLQANLY